MSTPRTAKQGSSGIVVQPTWLGAAAATVIGLVALWLTQQVPVRDVVLYLGYFLAVVALPGILLAMLLDRRPLGLAHVCAGIPLGFLQSMLALVVLAVVGVRGAAPWAPLVAAAVCIAVLTRREPPSRTAIDRRLRGEALAVAAIALVSICLLASRDFPQQPLPSHISGGASYYNDLPWHIGNVVTLERDWPPTDLRAVGEPLKYYIGDYLQAAQTAVATGVEPATIVLRLDPALQLVLVAFELFWVGRLVGRRTRTGVIAAFLVLLVGDLSSLRPATDALLASDHPANTHSSPTVLGNLYFSPTYLLGMVFFVPLLGVTVDWLRKGGSNRATDLAGPALLALGAALSKTMTVAVLLLAGVGLVAVEAIFRRRLFRPAIRLAGVCALTYAVLVPIVHRRDEESTLQFDILGSVRDSNAWHRFQGGPIDVLPHHAIPTILVVLGTAPVLLAGLAALVVVRRGRLDVAEWMLVLVGAAGAGVMLFFNDGHGGQFYFWFYGYVSLALLAAVGVDALLSARERSLNRIALAAGAVLVVFCVGSVVLQAGPAARRAVARVVPGVPGPFRDLRSSPPELTKPVLTGLLWLRARTSPNAVIAVNNVSNLQYPSYRYFYYSAFSERQIFLEGFDFTPAFSLGATRASVRELKRRLELTDRIFRDGSASAIEAAQRKYGVDYLLVDRRDTLPHHPPPASIARLVFSNADVQIYVIASPGVLATA